MDIKFIAVVAKATDRGEGDKYLTLITPQGIKHAVMRGVKKQGARLKHAAMPFAFCEFIAATKGNTATITGANSIEDLFFLCAKTDTLAAASIIAEAATFSFLHNCEEAFVFMLKCFKEILYTDSNPYVFAIKFLQYIIHTSGYEYEYEKVISEITTPLMLLSAISHGQDVASINNSLVLKTLKKIVINFEEKFDCHFKSMIYT